MLQRYTLKISKNKIFILTILHTAHIFHNVLERLHCFVEVLRLVGDTQPLSEAYKSAPAHLSSLRDGWVRVLASGDCDDLDDSYVEFLLRKIIFLSFSSAHFHLCHGCDVRQPLALYDFVG